MHWMPNPSLERWRKRQQVREAGRPTCSLPRGASLQQQWEMLQHLHWRKSCQYSPCCLPMTPKCWDGTSREMALSKKGGRTFQHREKTPLRRAPRHSCWERPMRECSLPPQDFPVHCNFCCHRVEFHRRAGSEHLAEHPWDSKPSSSWPLLCQWHPWLWCRPMLWWCCFHRLWGRHRWRGRRRLAWCRKMKSVRSPCVRLRFSRHFKVHHFKNALPILFCVVVSCVVLYLSLCLLSHSCNHALHYQSKSIINALVIVELISIVYCCRVNKLIKELSLGRWASTSSNLHLYYGGEGKSPRAMIQCRWYRPLRQGFHHDTRSN